MRRKERSRSLLSSRFERGKKDRDIYRDICSLWARQGRWGKGLKEEKASRIGRAGRIGDAQVGGSLGSGEGEKSL